MRGFVAPVVLRGGTSDFDVFRDVFLDEDYGQVDATDSVDIIVDCGANIGLASLYLLNKHRPSRLIAVEPDPANCEIARRNLEPYSGVATVIEAAIWPEPRRLRLVRGAYRDGRDWATTTEPGDGGLQINAVSLGSIMSNHHLPRIDILKIDIEGAERPLFAGNCSFLTATSNILIELHEDGSSGCTEVFSSAMMRFGFEVHEDGMTTVARRRPL